MTALADRVARAAGSAEPRKADLHKLDAFLGDAASDDLASLHRRLATPSIRRLLAGIADGSPYLWDLCKADPGRLARLLEADPARSLDAALANARAACEAADAIEDAMRALRLLKQEAALLVALCDLGQVWRLAEVTAALTRVADGSLDLALRFLLRAAIASGRFEPLDPGDITAGCGYVALAMGKHGAFELNYSSDIDLIVIYDPDAGRLGSAVDAGPFFVRLTQGLVRLLSERTSDGYVFRVDLRLRPDPGSTAIAIALPAAFAYYETAGQNWERAALIKARPCAGDLALGEAFLAELRPFIWRRHLDYAAIADIHAMKRQIQIHKGHAIIAVAGHDLKLGRGGIREIEFFVQTQQLIAGGRNPSLRGHGTVEMLAALHEGRWISRRARDELGAAYETLRTLEHRLQMVADEQTHALPADPDKLSRFARFAGYRNRAALETAVVRVLTVVQSHYASLFEAAPSLTSDAGSLVFTGKADDPETLETLHRLGYADPASIAETVRGWHFGRYVAMRSARAREDLTALTPVLLDALAREGKPDDTVHAFDRMLSHMPAGFQFFSLLRANPGLLKVLARILGVAPRLAEIVASRPHALDGLLDPGAAGSSASVESLLVRLRATLTLARDHEDRLDRARIFAREQIFQIGARLIAGEITAQEAAADFAALAEACIRAMLDAVIGEMERAHGRVPGGRLVVLGMGKLGGRELTAASDLDLIILYDHPPDVIESDGGRPIAPATWYARLTQRLVAAISAPTAEGTLYDVDLRLRPSGRKGPVAIQLAAFRDYQTTEAWTWEHMALTRARVAAGDPSLGADVAALIARVLRLPRQRDKILADVREMRALIAKEKGDDKPWSIKLAAGGLLDIEFMVQTLQLLNAAHHPGVLATHTGQAIEALRAAGCLPFDQAATLRSAFALLTTITQVLNLCLVDDFDPATAGASLKALVATAAGQPDFRHLDKALRETESAVRALAHALLA